MTDLLRFETQAQAGQPVDDIREVSNYVDAMMYGLERLEHLPLSLRLIREMHARLLQGGRGGTMSPGEFHRTQNWIGGTRPGNALFVPPPVTAPTINAALADLQRLEIVEEITGRKRDRVFGYRAYLDILNEGTTPLRADRR